MDALRVLCAVQQAIQDIQRLIWPVLSEQPARQKLLIPLLLCPCQQPIIATACPVFLFMDGLQGFVGVRKDGVSTVALVDPPGLHSVQVACREMEPDLLGLRFAQELVGQR